MTHTSIDFVTIWKRLLPNSPPGWCFLIGHLSSAVGVFFLALSRFGLHASASSRGHIGPFSF